jgi:hypothetical protein
VLDCAAKEIIIILFTDWPLVLCTSSAERCVDTPVGDFTCVIEDGIATVRTQMRLLHLLGKSSNERSLMLHRYTTNDVDTTNTQDICV